jgi:hypothetical protein
VHNKVAINKQLLKNHRIHDGSATVAAAADAGLVVPFKAPVTTITYSWLVTDNPSQTRKNVAEPNRVLYGAEHVGQ